MTLQHRGPDAQRVWVQNHVGLGHTRLAIIDLVAASDQPFTSASQQACIVYNGEVFNYLELKSELESLGRTFKTHSDTEVVLESYLQWGTDCVSRFNGMWAFAIYDKRDDSLFCSRDRFGIKPFVYAWTKNRLYFASECKAILNVAPEFRTPNFQSLSNCLRSSLSSAFEDTCFSGIQRLMPGHNLRVDRHGKTFSRYWNYPSQVNRKIQFAEAVEETQRLVADSTRLRMRSDVPIGLTLSSGLDSTYLAHQMRATSAASIHSYTSDYPGHSSSEAATAEATAKALSFKHSTIDCRPSDLIEVVKKIVEHVESPHCSTAMFPLWEIMKSARNSVKVLIEGQGADELFAGYLPMHFPAAVSQHIREWRPLKAIGELRHAYATTSSHSLLGSHYFFSNLIRSSVPSSHRYIRRFGRRDESIYDGPLKESQELFQTIDMTFADRLNRRLKYAHAVELVELLHYGDAISMAHGIESRVPFLDHRLVEFAFSLPGTFKLDQGVTKRVLRAASAKQVPAIIRENRKKEGFTTPFAQWLRGPMKDQLIEPLLSGKCSQRGIFATEPLRRLIDAHVRGKRDHSRTIYRMLLTELWFQEFIDG